VDSRQKQDDYITLFLVFCHVIEPWLKRIAFLLLTLLILFQLALLIPEIRNILSSAERLEGISISP
jgi:hypothetical protein